MGNNLKCKPAYPIGVVMSLFSRKYHIFYYLEQIEIIKSGPLKTNTDVSYCQNN